MESNKIIFPIFFFLSFLLVNLFLHLAWEFWQISFFAGMTNAPHGKAVLMCTQAALGDTVIALIAYGCASFAARSKYWLLTPSPRSVAIYLLVGILITMLFEYLATEVLHRWEYDTNMPRLPIFGTGLVPLVQWVIVPLISLPIIKWLSLGFRIDEISNTKR